MIRVMVVDDSIFMRRIISDMLREEKDIEVVAEGKNGKEAIELNEKLKPDVITLDIEMPIMDGLKALKHIMNTKPTKVIMVSSLTTEGARETIEALENGAFDFLPKPSGQISLDIRKVKNELLEKIRAASESNLKNIMRKETPKFEERFKLNKFVKKEVRTTVPGIKKDKVIAIGISTGGPKALQVIIPKFPEDLDAGILIVQHMPPKFTKSLAERLDTMSNIRVKEAEDGDKVKNGWAYIAPGDYHMIVRQEMGEKVIRINQEPSYSGHRPSANVMFRSVAETYKGNAVGVIMTGMGGDGAEFLKKMRCEGAKTIAQSQDTCVVYGMPRVAVELDAVDSVIDLDNIPDKTLEYIRSL